MNALGSPASHAGGELVCTPSATKRRQARWPLRALGTAVALALLATVFRHIDRARVVSLVWGLGPAAPLFLLPSVLAIACETFAWQHAIAKMARPVRFLSLFRVRVASESLAAVLPMGALWADTARPSLLARHTELPLGEGVASVVARKYLLVLSQAGYLLLGFFLGRPALEDGFRRAAGMPALCCLPLLGAAVLIAAAELSALAFRGGSVFRTLLNFASRVPRNPLGAGLRALDEGTRHTDRAAARFFRMRYPDRIWLSLSCLAGWILEAVETWIFITVLGAHVSPGDALAVETIVVLGRHVFVVLPGGLGVLELGYATFFGAAGASLDVCAAFVLMKRLREVTWAAIGCGLFAMDRALE